MLRCEFIKLRMFILTLDDGDERVHLSNLILEQIKDAVAALERYQLIRHGTGSAALQSNPLKGVMALTPSPIDYCEAGANANPENMIAFTKWQRCEHKSLAPQKVKLRSKKL